MASAVLKLLEEELASVDAEIFGIQLELMVFAALDLDLRPGVISRLADLLQCRKFLASRLTAANAAAAGESWASVMRARHAEQAAYERTLNRIREQADPGSSGLADKPLGPQPPSKSPLLDSHREGGNAPKQQAPLSEPSPARGPRDPSSAQQERQPGTSQSPGSDEVRGEAPESRSCESPAGGVGGTSQHAGDSHSPQSPKPGEIVMLPAAADPAYTRAEAWGMAIAFLLIGSFLGALVASLFFLST